MFIAVFQHLFDLLRWLLTTLKTHLQLGLPVRKRPKPCPFADNYFSKIKYNILTYR